MTQWIRLTLVAAVVWPLVASVPARGATIDVSRYAGFYLLPDGAPLIVWSAAEGQLNLAFGNGEVRGLAGQGDAWTYGPSIGAREPVQGRVQFTRDPRGALTGLTFKPEGGADSTARRAPLREWDISFEGRAGKLAGTIIAPESPKAGIVFLHGSGAETREPSRIFAYILAREGIASLIFDKRACGRSGGKSFNVPFAELAGDAMSGVSALQRELKAQALTVGLFGPSQGAWVALEAGRQSPRPAFLVLQSGDATSPLEQVLHQGAELLRLEGRFTDEEIKASVAFRRLKYLYAITGEGRAGFERAVGESLPNADFWKPNGLYDPLPALREFPGPVFAVFGARDTNKDVPENARLMREAFATSRNAAAAVLVIPDGNHGIFETKTGLPLERELPSLTRIAPGYLDALTGWLRERALR